MKTRQLLRIAAIATLLAATAGDLLHAQTTTILKRSDNRPLHSLQAAGQAALRAQRSPRQFPFVVPNQILKEDLRTQVSDADTPNQLSQDVQGDASTSLAKSFDGSDNDDNGRLLGFRVAPPDTDGDVGDSHYVQMINLLTTIYDKNGNVVSGPFPSNATWAGIGGLCEEFNQGDPIVLYDEAADRWLVSQFAFNDAFTQFAQCVAISASADPTGAYNRYEFDFDDIGFPDYPKHGIVSESITMMANVFQARGPFFRFTGTFIGVMDKAAMYAGNAATLVGFNLGSSEFGFVAGDYDNPSGSTASVPALFATAMSNSAQFDVWQIDIDWNNPGGAGASRVAALPISSFDPDLCSASREACVPQPGTNQQLEAITDRLMHRLQIRDFGTHLSMVAAHTVDVGNGRAGIRWYELRNGGSGWSLYQEGTFGPTDGRHRWMPSIAMNAAGDIGLGYLVSDGSTTFMSTAVAGQTAVGSGSGILDGAEAFCVNGSGAQTGTARAGDYSATAVDPVNDTFWHTNEYGPETGDFEWATRICEFAVSGGEPPPAEAPAAPSDLVATAVSSSQIDLSWTDNAGNEDGTEIERSDDNATFAVIATVGPNVTGYSDTGLPASATRYYKVRAFNEVGYSDYSNTASATTLEEGLAESVHVESIVTGTENVNRGNKLGFADVTIHDNLGQPVEGATVDGTFSGSWNEPASGVTGPDGTAHITTSTTQRGGLTVNFCVNTVTASLTYNSADNTSASYDCSGSASKAGISAATSTTPDGFDLAQNFPNPFNPVTSIGFSLAQGDHVVLKVYNILGEEVATLVDEFRGEGSHQVRFDATGLSTGVYIYTIRTGSFAYTRRMSLLK